MHMMAKTPFPVMIFAAGFGRRMGALTKDKPKPLVPVKGRALIDYAVDIARESGAQTILVNLHYKHQMLADHLRDAPVQTRLELPDILETGGGLKAALPQLGAADWSLSDPAITDALESYGRSGVPLYLLHTPDGKTEILPQNLTPAIVRIFF